MDRTATGLEPDPCPDGDLLCRVYARVSPLPLEADVKGSGAIQLLLTFIPADVMLLTRRQLVNPAAASNKFCFICILYGVYTDFGMTLKWLYLSRPEV